MEDHILRNRNTIAIMAPIVEEAKQIPWRGGAFSMTGRCVANKSSLARYRVVALAVFTASCAIDTPFPATVEVINAHEFQFEAEGTWALPVNSEHAEKIRLEWLGAYLREKNICPSGYKIVHKSLHRVHSVKALGAHDQDLGRLTYTGQCIMMGPGASRNEG